MVSCCMPQPPRDYALCTREATDQCLAPFLVFAGGASQGAYGMKKYCSDFPFTQFLEYPHEPHVPRCVALNEFLLYTAVLRVGFILTHAKAVSSVVYSLLLLSGSF